MKSSVRNGSHAVSASWKPGWSIAVALLLIASALSGLALTVYRIGSAAISLLTSGFAPYALAYALVGVPLVLVAIVELVVAVMFILRGGKATLLVAVGLALTGAAFAAWWLIRPV